eukprot:TRINITY_DN4794_c0_g1_i1.p1 TRINITY_DN4794_c0_g1~~TRINITY_DN4794_c0_g1_i1.p1  ORF type:complete len:1175 (+),score=547.54 TRINITY_DN4794_c0_g1_i1:144-3668(+)
MDFLGGDNKCGQQLLKLVARGSSILAELSRLAEKVPPAFKTKTEYSRLLFDFTYFKPDKTDAFERLITNDAVLSDRDEEFRETHLEMLQRFYQLFESIWKYCSDLLQMWEDIRAGNYIQQTFESILMNQDGKQLMAESLYLYGAMLLQLDLKIPGLIRERMLVAFSRYISSKGEHFEQVCGLFRNTGFEGRGKPRPQRYPEEYFGRIKVPADIVDMIIGRLRSDDVYQMAYRFPAPDARSTALATQGGMLYVILYFRPDILIHEKPVMREIVYKHFVDNWIISYYMGEKVDLTVEWAPYEMAAQSINNMVDLDNARHYQRVMKKKLTTMTETLQELLREGVLNEGFVLDRIHSSLLPTVRDCNVCLRWFLLHETTGDAAMRALVMDGVSRDDVLMLLLKTSQLEYLLVEMFGSLLKTKADKWDELKDAAQTKMDALEKYFGGEGVLATDDVDENLAAWFGDISEKIADLDYENCTQAGRTIQNIMNALSDVEQYHQVDSNLQARQFLIDTRTLLKTMVRYVNIVDDVIVTVQSVGDFSYGWRVIHDYVQELQAKIKADPSLVIQIRSMFLKLVSMMEIPLVRIHEAGSLDIHSVSEYYSSQLVDFVRTVMSIIPSSMFEQLDHVIPLISHKVKELPTKLPKESLREYAQFDLRYSLASTTFEISKFTDGILAMEKTLMGIVQIDPQKLLEDGIRKELVTRLSTILHNSLQFGPGAPANPKDPKAAPMTFEQRLHRLAMRLEGIRDSLEYVQDYMNVYGLKIWQEEFERMVNFHVEMEANNYLTKKVLSWESRFQSTAIPIPNNFPPVAGVNCTNYMGRLAQELLRQTDSRVVTYIDQLSAWYDHVRGEAVVSHKTFNTLHRSVGTPGMVGLDRLVAFMIVKDLQTCIKYVKEKVLASDLKVIIPGLKKNLGFASTLPRDAVVWYAEVANKCNKSGIWNTLLEKVIRVGESQLLRKHIQKDLQFSCKLNSAALFSALTTLNEALINDVRAHMCIDSEKHRYPNGRVPILPELRYYLDKAGVGNPYTQVYVTAEPVNHLTFILVLFVICHLGRFQYDPQSDSLVSKRKDDGIDGVPFVVGLVTILKQFHSDEKDAFVGYLCQYVRVLMDGLETSQQKLKEKDKEILPSDVCVCLLFLEMFCKYADVDKKLVGNLIPPYLLAKYREYAHLYMKPGKR